MDKTEFLETLRQSLSGEVALEIIEQNHRYYDQYITRPTKDEEDQILKELGDPRLIAKTIIETDKAAKMKAKYTDYNSYSGSFENRERQEENRSSTIQKRYFANMKWYQKLAAVAVVLILLVILAFMGRIIIGLVFAFGLPIIIIMMLLALFRRK